MVVFWALDFQGLGCWTLGDLGKGEERKKRMVYESCGQFDVTDTIIKINTTAFEKTVCLWGIFFGIYWMADGNVI